MPRKAYIREIEVPATTATIKLTRLHMNVIAAIADESFATQNEMADDLGMSHGSFHIAVSRLCQRVGVLHSPRNLLFWIMRNMPDQIAQTDGTKRRSGRGGSGADAGRPDSRLKGRQSDSAPRALVERAWPD